MGVHGLSGYLKRIGFDQTTNDNPTTSLSHNSSTLAIDGNGLLFHLFRLSYYRHYKNVTSSNQSKSLRSQLLLPSFVPLALAHELTTHYLSSLTIQHGIHLKIYFDGSNQFMKRLEKASRKERREDEWENVRQFCLNGVLPQSGTNKFRSSARRQAKGCELNNGSDLRKEDGSDPLAEVYLSSFPVSPLVMDQIERSIYAFEEMSPVLSTGSIQIIECDGEADSEVARASADDESGKTYALACDSDYLIYGYANHCEQNGNGETKYLQFGQADPVSDELWVGNVLTRSDVAATIGLPFSSAMVELSILMGNDYTGPFVKHEDMKKRKEYWENLQWCQPGEEDCGDGERLPPETEMSWFDVEGIAEHVAEKVSEGLKLTSDNEELRLAIEFSYALYSFGDVSNFPSTAPESAAAEDDESNEVDVGAAIFPSLPIDLDLSLARNASSDNDIVDAALYPLASYKSNVGPDEDELQYLEQRHLDAFRMTWKTMTLANPERHVDPPRHKMRWADMQAKYMIEKCLSAAIEDSAAVAPYVVFDHSVFHSCLESLSFDDFPFDNELVSKNEKSFLEEATEHPSIHKTEEVGPLVLPIDEHKEEILRTVKTQRITIIHGETGCGKSSRVPCFLLRADPPEPTPRAPEVKMIVSQPRRIAAKALAERVRSCEPDLTDKIGLRMGHGIREFETSKTRAWFVTTGYVVRLLANHPSWFDSHTHLIIDEVHERSVDTDILCLLCRRLLASHPTIRLVLMSATMAAELYSQYFGSPQPPIHVGARRFSIREYFVEDLSKAVSLPPKHAKLAQQVYEECEKVKCQSAPSSNSMERLYKLATQITSSVGDTGSSVLIFVPGMADIEALSELIEGLRVPNVSFICLPIHSDIPFEEQMAAFDPPKAGEVKVIIATNAAESSLTLPDVDHVICLGLCKQITYNSASHRQMLVPTWISRASATQRAGRTGRVREGTVYRLYSRNAFCEYMAPYESGEMVRIPLDQVILSLKDMLGEAIKPILLECLEPPDIANIERSFRSLHESNFISHPSDEGDITSLGTLVVALGIDLTLGALVGLGIQFGVAAECIELAAILSFPKTPWAITSPLYHDTDTFNEIVSKTFTSRCYFDGGSMSEPMAISNLLSSFSTCQNRNSFIWKHRVSGTRMKHLHGTVQSLKQRVAERLGIKVDALKVEESPFTMHPAKLNILRILHVWLFHDTMIVHNTSKSKIECLDGGLNIELDGPPITRDHLLQVLNEERHQFQLKSCGKISQHVRFDLEETLLKEGGQYFDAFDIRFASLALDKEISLSYYSATTYNGNLLKIFIPGTIWEAEEGRDLRDAIIGNVSGNITEQAFVGNKGSGNQRGIRGRSCGAWHPISIDSILAADETLPQRRVFIISCAHSKSKRKEIQLIVDTEIAKSDYIKNAFCCTINQTKKRVTASLEGAGECEKVSDVDLGDLFAAHIQMASVSKCTMRQTVFFPSNVDDLQSDKAIRYCPLLIDAPEGARLMQVLASERRKDNFIRFSNEDESFVDVNIPKKFAINTNKWKRRIGGGMVFVPENCVPSAILPNRASPSVSSSLPPAMPPSILPPADQGMEVFACCANTLDLRGGACRVDGISLMPPGRLFTGLALLCFGLHPRTGLPVDSDAANDFTVEEKKEGHDVDSVLREATDWIFEKEGISVALEENWRVLEALNFHKSCMALGELLECQPDKIQALCDIFDGVSGPMAVWDGYDVSLAAKSASLRSRAVEKDSDDKKKQYKGATKKHVESTSTHVGAAHKCNPLAVEVEANGSAVATKEASSQNGARIEAKHQRQIPWLNEGQTMKPRWKCMGCNESFAKRKKCLRHMRQCHSKPANSSKPKEIFPCPGCDEIFINVKQCCLHMKICFGSSTLTSAAPKSGGFKESLASTLASKPEIIGKASGPQFESSGVVRSDLQEESFKSHVPSIADQSDHHEQATYSVGTTDTALTAQKVTLRKDASTTTIEDQILKGRWACPGCNSNQTFTKRKACVKHMEQCLVHVSERPQQVFICKCCSMKFYELKQCRSHVMDCLGTSPNHTMNPVGQPVAVTLACDFDNRNTVTATQRPKKRWECQGCKQSFVKRKICAQHMEHCLSDRNHLSPKPFFECECCHKRFTKRLECYLHINSCLGSSSQLEARSSIAEHEVSDTTTLPGEGATQNDDLIGADQRGLTGQSIGLKTMKERWECHGCNESFPRKKKCLEHMEKCCFILVKNAMPRKVFMCRGCKNNFVAPKECQLHMKLCLRTVEKKKSTPKPTMRKVKKPNTNEDAQKEIFVCKCCSLEFNAWESCLTHMVECNIGILATLEHIDRQDFILEH